MPEDGCVKTTRGNIAVANADHGKTKSLMDDFGVWQR